MQCSLVFQQVSGQDIADAVAFVALVVSGVPSDLLYNDSSLSPRAPNFHQAPSNPDEGGILHNTETPSKMDL